jgi:hypothetical protein
MTLNCVGLKLADTRQRVQLPEKLIPDLVTFADLTDPCEDRTASFHSGRNWKQATGGELMPGALLRIIHPEFNLYIFCRNGKLSSDS